MKHAYIIPALILCSSLAMAGCKGRHQEADLSGIHTSAARETMSTTAAPAVEVTTAAETVPVSKPSDDSSGNVSAKIETYKDTSNGSVSIQYPVVSNLSDAKTQTAVNELLLTNATAILTAMPEDEPVTLDITCQVISVDRSRITAVYKGTRQVEGGPYPVNVFYTNTVDLKLVKSLGFNDYADAYTMAGYLMSDDVAFYQASSETTRSLLAHRSTSSVEEYTQLFNKADFPLSTAEDAVFPESFSYTHEGVLYFSIPVPHVLGDYAIVTFDIDGK